MRKICFAAAFLAAVLSSSLAEKPAATPVVVHKAADRKIDQQFVEKQFGDQFTLLPDMPPTFGDLDGDGVEDVVIAARCKNPMLDQAEHHYRVIDPYHEFFGYGDPRITTTISEGIPDRRGLVALIIHGSGTDAWRAETPKAKFVMVNLPYRSMSIRKLDISKKRTVDALFIEEAEVAGASSAIFFDGKKFHYMPMGGDME